MSIEKVRPCGCIVRGIPCDSQEPKGWEVIAPCKEHAVSEGKPHTEMNKIIRHVQIQIVHLDMYIKAAEERGYGELTAALRPELKGFEAQLEKLKKGEHV
jgi:hypothetical protein